MKYSLEELERLANATRPGPWIPERDGDGEETGVITLACEIGNNTIIQPYYPHENSGVNKEEAAFIVAARTAIPELVVRMRKLEAVVTSVSTVLKLFTNYKDLTVAMWAQCILADIDKRLDEEPAP